MVLLSLFWLLLASGVIAEETKPGMPEPQLTIHLRGEVTRIVKGNALKFAVEIRNVGSEPCWIYSDLTPSVWLHIYDESGREVQPHVLYDHVRPPPRLGTDDLLLRPDHSLTLHDTYPAIDLALPAGRYTATIDLIFLSPTDKRADPACAGWVHPKDRISVEVVE